MVKDSGVLILLSIVGMGNDCVLEFVVNVEPSSCDGLTMKLRESKVQSSWLG
jgi:hypothetical protein